MSIFTKTFIANETHPFPGGNSFVYLVGSNPINIEFLKDGSPIENVNGARPGYRKKFATAGARYFTAVRITSESAQDIEIDVSDFDTEYQSLELGQAKLNEHFRSTDSNAFVVAMSRTAGAAGTFRNVQVVNDDSDRTFAITSLLVRSDTAQNIGVDVDDTPTLIGSQIALNVARKNGAGVLAGVLLTREEASVSGNSVYWQRGIAADEYTQFLLKDPIILNPGGAVGVFSQAADGTLDVYAEGHEII